MKSIKNCSGLLLALAFLATCAPSFAEVLPGDLITPVNAAKVKELVSPGVYYKVVNGMSMKIALTERIEWPPPFMNATEKYSGQVRLSQDGRSLQVAGGGGGGPQCGSTELRGRILGIAQSALRTQRREAPRNRSFGGGFCGKIAQHNFPV